MARLQLPPARNNSRCNSSSSILRFFERVLLFTIASFAVISTLVISRRLFQEQQQITTLLKNNNNSNKKNNNNKVDSSSESMVVYDLQPGVAAPQFGDLVPDPIRSNSMFVSRSKNTVLIPIDQVHRQGLYHTGTWQHVVDKQHRILLLQRGPQLVTCPNAWALPGEHTLGLEMPLETAQRGMQEELGTDILQYVERYELLTVDPVFYIRDYGPSNGNRVDRQLVYLWYIPLRVAAEQVQLQLDKEVVDHQWMPIVELEEKIRLAQKQLQQQQSHTDKKEQAVWYCDVTLLRLYELGLSKLQERLQAAHDNKKASAT
jgi:8-oxo-dGTP pyrophosphatase MutT (NUDIX family)